MRIIGGSKKGHSITAPKGENTRPTSDRVREAIFSMLQARLDFQQLRVLDLYAGSGALALESLSRGAGEAVLVEKDRTCCGVIRRNIEALEFSERCRLLDATVERALKLLANEGASFDLVLLDPPYRYDPWPIVAILHQQALISDEGLVLVEHDKKRIAAEGLEKLATLWHRIYGDTAITLFGYQSS